MKKYYVYRNYIKKSHLAGIEPATPRLEVWCATNCATSANDYILDN